MKQTGQKGFTMLELLIVIAILGIIYVIAVPQYVSYREKSERASIYSGCRSLYRAFVVFYLEHEEYPYATAGSPLFNKETFFPLTDGAEMAGAPFEIDIDSFRDKLDGRKAEAYDSPDDTLGDNQEFYIVLPWKNDPDFKFIVAASNDIEYADGTLVDGGNWVDGVYMSKDGAILGQ